MPGFGSGLAHALTQGIAGYQSGQQDRTRELIMLAAQQRAAKQADESMGLKRLETLGQLGALGYDIGGTGGGDPIAQAGTPVQDSASRRATQDQTPTSPEGGDATPAPPTASGDGTMLGSVGGVAIKVPPGGVQSKAVRDAAAKARERLNRLQTLNDQITDPKQQKTPNQLQAIANDDGLYNQYVAQATGVATRNIDPNSPEGISAALDRHKQERLFDVAHPTRDVSGDHVNWETKTTADGTMVQVNPRTGETRPIGLKGHVAGSGGPQTQAARYAASAIPELTSAARIIDQFDDPTIMSQLAKKAGLFGNYLNTPEGRQLNQPIEQFVTLSELAKGNKRPTDQMMQRFVHIYAPAPGDDIATRRQKKAARDNLIASVTAVSGQTAATPAAPSGSLQGASEDQQLWDAAVAKHGRDRVLREYGPRPQ